MRLKTRVVDLVDIDELTEVEWGRWFARRGRLDVSLLLFVLWDPVGVLDAPEAFDEYDGYAAACLGPIRRGNVTELAEVLAATEQRAMGFTTQPQALQGKAQTLIAGARASVLRWAQSGRGD